MGRKSICMMHEWQDSFTALCVTNLLKTAYNAFGLYSALTSYYFQRLNYSLANEMGYVVTSSWNHLLVAILKCASSSN